MSEIAKVAFRAVARERHSTRRRVAAFARTFTDARVLEIGSGKPVDGAYPYSCADLVDDSCDLVMSDIDPDFGHAVVDVTDMHFDAEFDIVLCANVLEHVWDVQAAAAGILRALKPGGRALVVIPMMYPLHDEPFDFWRITEHGLRRLFAEFEIVRLGHRGLRLAPVSYELELRRPGR